MAADAKSAPLPNGVHDPNTPLELAVDLPQSPGTRVHIHLSILANSIMLFLTSTTPESHGGASSMGSLVFAMPDRYNPTQPLSTTLYSVPSSLDFTARMAKVLVRRLKKPCYVGSSVDLSGSMGGGSVEDEIAAFRAVVKVVVAEAEKAVEAESR